MNPTERVIIATKATGIREAAERLVGADLVFDSDSDNAFVAARLHEIADEYDKRSGMDTTVGFETAGVRACGDYPAPCNCDDPTTHKGH